MDDDPLAAGDYRDLGPLPEGAAPVRVVQLVGGLAASGAQDLLGIQDSASELKFLRINTMDRNFKKKILPEQAPWRTRDSNRPAP